MLAVRPTPEMALVSISNLLADRRLKIVNHEEVVQTAQQHGSGDSSLFSSAMSFVNGNKVRLSGSVFSFVGLALK